jgi:hypothetical protein
MFLAHDSSPWDFLSAFLEVPNGMFYILEVSHIIFGNFGSFSSDFVHFWKLLLGCCVFMEVEEVPKCTKSHEELPKISHEEIQ